MSFREALVSTVLLVSPIQLQPVLAQSTGQILGRVIDLSDSLPVNGAQVLYGTETLRTGPITGPDGKFVIIGVPPGRYRVHVRRIGYRTGTREDVTVASGSSVRVTIALAPNSLELSEIRVEAEEPSLLASDITASRQVVSRDEIEQSPIESIDQVLDLQTGVSGGHFRGGRLGQETFVVDGINLKDQFAASGGGTAFALAPAAIEELNVITSGFSADLGTAISGVVSVVSRQGPRDRWIGRVEYVTDDWAPAGIKRGYVRGGVSAGGPVGFLGDGARFFADLTVFGQGDQDPRVQGLTCLEQLGNCPADQAIIPHQRGDRYLGFARLDVPLTDRFETTLTFNRNRDQHELYSTRFKYNLEDYLAERETATWASLTLAGQFQSSSARAMKLTSRITLARLDRYLGVPEPDQAPRLGRFRLGDLSFRGESFTRLPVREQIESGTVIPGYEEPSDSGAASPYGILGADLFVTDGTSGIAQWSRTDFVDLDLEFQALASSLNFKLGGNAKLFHISTYQHVAGGLPGAAPNFAEFYPAVLAGYAHQTLFAEDGVTIDLGVRVEGFQPKIEAPADRSRLTAPTETADWRVLVSPRVGMVVPLSILGVDRAAVRWNFGRFSQPPDFQFFFDQALDDSLNTAVRRQGNPNLGFESAIQYEVGFEYLLTNDVVLKVAGFFKELSGLTTSGIAVADLEQSFTNLDFGRVTGGEVRLEARPDMGQRIELGYALQEAKGVASTAFDSTVTGTTDRIELPLQFDRRHTIDLNAYWSLPNGFGLSLAGEAASGAPVPGAADFRLPWTAALSARVVKRLRVGGAVLTLIAEGRNLLNRDNLVTARPGGGTEPNVEALRGRAQTDTRDAVTIPRESALYVAAFDRDGDGLFEPGEQTAARFAALLDANEPTLLFGEARQIRLGMEWDF